MIKIFGHSDDLIEVKGDILKEFYVHNGYWRLVTASNGVLLRIQLTDAGVWRIQPLAGADRVVVVQAPEDDEDNYFDIATIAGDVEWVACGNDWASRKGQRDA